MTETDLGQCARILAMPTSSAHPTTCFGAVSAARTSLARTVQRGGRGFGCVQNACHNIRRYVLLHSRTYNLGDYTLLASRQHSTSCIEVWVELCIGHGHAELAIDGLHYGFWAKTLGRGRHGLAFQNRPSVVQRLDSDEFAHFYERFWQRSVDNRKSPRLQINVYTIPVNEKAKQCVQDYIARVQRTKPPYNPRGAGKSLNCVKFCVQTLRRCGILPASFSALEVRPRPSGLDDALARLAKRRQHIRSSTATLAPTHFRRRKAKKR